MNMKQNFLETVHWGKPEALVNEWEPFGSVFDPLMGMTLVAQQGKSIVDSWGVTMCWGMSEPGPTPYITEETKAIKDITRWREEIKSPDLAGADLDWSGAREQKRLVEESGKLSMSLMATGIFEQAHYLMGFEDTLVNLMIEPEAMHELLDYILEYKLTYCRLLIENLKPDVILSHDDWGTKTSLFMSPEIWREFFKPRYAKLYGYMKEQGVIVIHHADSHLERIIEDLPEIGIDIWQGVLPQNDIQAMQAIARGKMLLMGGIDAPRIDHPDACEEAVRAEVRRACAAYAPGGGFIPCLTYGGEGSIYPGVNDIIMDEIRSISPQYFAEEGQYATAESVAAAKR